MTQPGTPRITRQTLRVLSALSERPAEELYGRELIERTGLKSGTLYPVLARLEQAGWLESHWEETDPQVAGRPRRRFYRLTAQGEPAARRELSLARSELAGNFSPKVNPGLA
jgi:PadR family transcriptional regulator, regulatory protein PadR